MAGDIISYNEMCRREGQSNLQRGMNYGIGGTYSVILMSVRRGAPYRDRWEEGGSVLIYEGHDEPRSAHSPEPKQTNQPKLTRTNKFTQNGLFQQAAHQGKVGERLPETVRVYEKIINGVWSYNGLFSLVDAWQEFDGVRQVFKFKLVALAEDEANQSPVQVLATASGDRRRVIPSAVKQMVWKRDGGKCTLCGASDELHFDHIIPFSQGGTSLTVDNVQLLCARHNLQKSNKII